MSIPPLAVYLVAGRGSRLGNMTEETPKCLISINKEPLLTRSLIQISALGVKKVILVVGYKSDVIKKEYRSSFNGMEICYVSNADWEITNNLVSFYLAFPFIDSDYILLEGDLIYTDEAISKMVHTDSIAVSPLKPHMDGTIITKDNNDYVKMMYLKSSIVRPEKSESVYKTVNIYCFSKSNHKNFIQPSVKRLVENESHQSYYEQAFTTVIENNSFPIEAITFGDQVWYEIDTEEDLKEAKKLFDKK